MLKATIFGIELTIRNFCQKDSLRDSHIVIFIQL
jgi:hypothetical protein